ncbi:alpha/beta fold hydrolase [Mycobacterium neglectum]|uniref:alpha/beta fold hydrolase n=1 Tax=Mycobacterium neglectum TaxID=242737 RepID=UPI000BFEEC74|nr:alpha/beta fold hydrolase [Mycobacterium neglectum]
MRSQSGRVTVPLAYDRTGPAGGPVVVLLHSVGLDRTFWAPVATALEHRYTAVRVDLRGHGESPSPPGPWSLEDLADDVAEVLRSMGVERAHVVGQSFGGLVAQHLAIRYPDMVMRLVLSGTSCTTSESERSMFLERADLAEAHGMEPVARAAIARWFTDTGMNLAVVRTARQRLLSNDPDSWAKTFHAIAGHNVLDSLHDVYARTLVVTGDADVATPPHFAAEMAAALPNSEMKILDNVPHMGYLEQPALMARTILDFLDREA